MSEEPFIQIAGVIDQAEADLLVACGIKFIGFPLRLPVHKEDVSEEEARDIIRTLPKDVESILITYLNLADDIIELGEKIGASYVQIHGTISRYELLKLKSKHPDWYLIKSLVVGKHSIDALKDDIRKMSDLVDAFITDTYDSSTGASGATGKTHDWAISRDLVNFSPKPIILAGGLNDTNVGEAVVIVGPQGVDSHTGVEDMSGRKDPQKIKKFLFSAKKALEK